MSVVKFENNFLFVNKKCGFVGNEKSFWQIEAAF